jgi:hypothetical protein
MINQTRPDQTRPDQTRQDQTRPDQTRHIINVIVPCYKITETYLHECIQSVASQIFPKCQKLGICVGWKLVLVNDGNPVPSGGDYWCDCAKIINDYAARQPQKICAIHRSNGGVLRARNSGLDEVHRCINPSDANYIVFVDDDDKISPGFLDTVFLNLYESNVDLVCASYYAEKNAGGEVRICEWINETIDLTVDPKRLNKLFCSVAGLDCWAKLFKYDPQARFPDKSYEGEDCAYLLGFLKTPKKIMFLNADAVHYFYRANVNSITKNFRLPEKDNIANIDAIINCAEKYDCIDHAYGFLFMHLAILGFGTPLLQKNHSIIDSRRMFRLLRIRYSSYLAKAVFSGFRLEYKIPALLLKYRLYLLIAIYFFIAKIYMKRQGTANPGVSVSGGVSSAS